MSEDPGFQPGQYRIVVVDDEAAMLGILHRTLEARGYQISSFDNPADVVESIQVHGGDLLLTDYHMPGMTGLNLVQELRSGGWKGQVVVMSGHIHNVPRSQLESLGVKEFLEKPFSPFSLYEVLRKSLSPVRA